MGKLRLVGLPNLEEMILIIKFINNKSHNVAVFYKYFSGFSESIKSYVPWDFKDTVLL